MTDDWHPTFSSDTFAIDVHGINGVTLLALKERLSSALLSDGEIDAMIGRLHLELDGVAAEMRTAARNIRESDPFGDDDA